MDLANTVCWEFPCETIQCAVPSGRGDLPLYCESSPSLDPELKEMLAGIAGRIKTLFFVGISTDIPSSSIWDVPFKVPWSKIREYLQDSTGPEDEIMAKHRRREAKEMKNSKHSGHRKTQPVPIAPSPPESILVTESYHPMTTRNRSNHSRSPVPTSAERVSRFRPANVSQDARGGKIRFPSVSHDLGSIREDSQDVQSMEG